MKYFPSLSYYNYCLAESTCVSVIPGPVEWKTMLHLFHNIAMIAVVCTPEFMIMMEINPKKISIFNPNWACLELLQRSAFEKNGSKRGFVQAVTCNANFWCPHSNIAGILLKLV